MRSYVVRLVSPISKGFRSVKAANSLDIDVAKKAVHELAVDVDLEGEWNVGLIVGSSGSGKTTLAREIWGDDCFKQLLREDAPVIEQFPKEWSYDDCVSALTGVGLNQVICWIRDASTLSNGQKCRAEIALQMAKHYDETVVIDEWTSVVDRTVAKVMSHCINKHARRENRRIVLLSCHYDIFEWVDPDWVIDCNKQSYTDRRLLQRRPARKEKLQFDIREIDGREWKYFSKYHYLSDKLPGGERVLYGLFHGSEQVGFQCFANYYAYSRTQVRKQMHSNRTVIHPDYAGFGLGIRLINETSEIMSQRGYDVRAKYSSTPIYRSMKKQPCWALQEIKREYVKPDVGAFAERKSGYRVKVKTYSFKYIPECRN